MDADRRAKYPFIPGPVSLAIAGGDGSYLLTTDGRRVLDGGGGAVVANIGHGRPEPAEAAAASLSGGAYSPPIWATEARVTLIERLRSSWLPKGLTRCLLVNGGSESVDSALRIARQHHVAAGEPDRWKMIGRTISYHGATLATLSVANHDRRRATLEPMLADFPKADAFDIDSVRKLVESEDPATIAAIVVEPVSGASGGALVPPDDYLPGLRKLCDETGILLIADEVMTGFGRTGKAFGVDHHGVVPDLLVGGKGLGGGYVPIGGVFATDAVVEPIAEAGLTVMYFTFSGSDVVCAVADRVLQIMEDEQLVERAAVQGRYLSGLLHDTLGDHPTSPTSGAAACCRASSSSKTGTLAQALTAPSPWPPSAKRFNAIAGSTPLAVPPFRTLCSSVRLSPLAILNSSSLCRSRRHRSMPRSPH